MPVAAQAFIEPLPVTVHHSDKAVPEAVIQDTAQEFILSMPVAGLQHEQIDVCIQDCILYVSARKNKKHVHCGNKLCEHDCVLWRRAFKLPEHVDTLMTSALCKLGELIIRMPKNEPASQEDVTIYVY